MITLLLALSAGATEPIQISHHWHMHQPIYWPYESVTATESRGSYSYSVADVHNQRSGPYTAWPMDAVGSAMGRGMAHAGAQVSLSGSLMENLDGLEAAGWGFSGWKSGWSSAQGWKTDLGNPRLYLVSFGYHHPLMALIDPLSLQLQVELHREAVKRAFGVEPGAGMFPPECAFSPRMIPALEAAGIEWVMVDSIHLERAHLDYPYSQGSNLVPPNGADRWNDHPTDWVSLDNIWAPSPVAAPWAYQPHQAVYLDPDTGEEHKLTVVPAARYEGNEDARGGYGALVYDSVLRSYLPQNTDADHPMLVLMHHDGDNYGGGTESYYHSNYDAMLSWLEGTSDFELTTVQDYLDRFPPDEADTLHVEDGSWSGADNGDAEFAKWNGDPGSDGYSPDRHSWAVLTATLNHVATAEALSPHTSAAHILDDTGSWTDRAWRWLLVGETSCYWYWDNSEGGTWDSHPTRAANQAAWAADQAISAAGGGDPVGPSIYPPQREPYNPGAYEWSDTAESEVFEVWTLVYDLSGLEEVVLEYRVDHDGCRDAANEVYPSGGWREVAMSPSDAGSRTDPEPTVRAQRYSAEIDAGTDVLVDYYVRATDTLGHTTRSDIFHVVVGAGSSGGGLWEPEEPTTSDLITVFSDQPGQLHWGVNGWTTPDEVYWPSGTTDWGDGHAVESPLADADGDGVYTVELGPFDQAAQSVSSVDFVFHWQGDAWSSPDQVISISSSKSPAPPSECVPYYRSGGWDGGTADTGDPVDTGEPVDTDETDEPVDTGTPDDTEPPDGPVNYQSCGCSSLTGAWTWSVALPLLVLGRRRRR